MIPKESSGFCVLGILNFCCFPAYIGKSGIAMQGKMITKLILLNTQSVCKNPLGSILSRGHLAALLWLLLGIKRCLFYLFHTQLCACDPLEWQNHCAVIFLVGPSILTFHSFASSRAAPRNLPSEKTNKGKSQRLLKRIQCVSEIRRVRECACTRAGVWKGKTVLKWGIRRLKCAGQGNKTARGRRDSLCSTFALPAQRTVPARAFTHCRYSRVLIRQTRARQDPIFLSLDST